MIGPPATDQPAVRITDVTKRFRIRQGWLRTLRHPLRGPTLEALRDVSLVVESGECFGLLGQNGAGKTTLFKIVATLVLADDGSVQVFGADARRQGRAVRRLVAPVIANERSLYWRLSARENLRLFAALHGLDRVAADDRIAELLQTVGLVDAGGRMVAEYSTGMKQRLLIARALLAQPSVLLLDEPTRSLDPVSAEEFRRFLREDIIHRHGCTVLLATHDAEEVRDLCDRVSVLERGRILTTGRTEDLMDRYGDASYRVWTTNPEHPLLVALAADAPPPMVTPGSPNGWRPVDITLAGDEAEAAVVLDRLVAEGVPVARFEKVGLSLADLLRRVIASHPEAP